MTRDNYSTSTTTPAAVDVTTVDIRAGERIRWGAIMAGLFTALSTLIVLSILGVAIGLTAWDQGAMDRGGWNWGAGIWGAISMIVAFIFGGWVAARWGTSYGHDSGALLHGAMVWAVAIPISLFVLGSIGTMFGTQAMDRGAGTAQLDRFDGARPAGAQLGEMVAAETTQDPQAGARRAAVGAAWGTLISLLLGLGAAALGGYLGAAGNRDPNWYGRGTRSSGNGGTGTTAP